MRDAASADEAGVGTHARRSGWRASALRAAIVSLALLAALFGWSRLQPRGVALHGSALQSVPAPAFTGFTDTQGRVFSWRQQRGHVVLVFFGYTHCPDVCPLTLAALAQSLQRLGALRQRVRVVFVTLDPARDTLPVLRAYLDGFLPDTIGLHGSLAAVTAASRQWDITWRRVDTGPGQYWIDHTAAVTLVSPDGRLLVRYGYGQLTNPAWLADDLRHILEP
ncbi:MAG: electron transport protein SCO1/SenC [Thiomonas sp. 20-64-5]|nr:MAG: electron transport protein SCO1/SenC [Thiomonas sp. 20-64-5]